MVPPVTNLVIYTHDQMNGYQGFKTYDAMLEKLLFWCYNTERGWMLIDRTYPMRWLVVVDREAALEFDERFGLPLF